MLLAMIKIEGKKQQTNPCGEDKKEKQNKLRMNLWNVYILVWNTNVSNRIHLRIVNYKDIKLKQINIVFFNYLENKPIHKSRQYIRRTKTWQEGFKNGQQM